ncbi:MAG: hypothetical protein LH478_02670 [Chitinophagaceae bacterium]|nr:hypothetical protein [Chitinophagaceae bacterium]
MKIFFNILISVLVFSCKKNDTGIDLSLPSKTQTGQNTFGFLLNSQVWINYGQVCFPFAGGCRENLSGFYYSSDGDIHINADKVLYKNSSWSTYESIDLNLATNFRSIGTYSTLTRDTIGVAYWYSEQGQPKKTYLLSQTIPTFTIAVTKADTVNNILAGEFSGKLFRRISDISFATSTTDSIIIDNGRFDIKLK